MFDVELPSHPRLPPGRLAVIRVWREFNSASPDLRRFHPNRFLRYYPITQRDSVRLVSRSANDLTGLLLCQRKAMAQRLVAELTPSAHLSARFEAGSARVMREMSARGLEGLIAKQNWPRTSRAPGGGSLRLVRCGFAPGWSRSEGEKPAEMVREQPQ